MNDRRLHPFNGRVAHVSLRGQVDAEVFTKGRLRQLSRTEWLRRKPGGAIDRQLLFGDAFLVLEDVEGASFGVSQKDGYVGWVPSDALAASQTPTHRVAVRTTWLWPRPDIKAEPLQPVHMNCRVTVKATAGDWTEIWAPGGSAYMATAHLMRVGSADDAVAAAHLMLGTPYVWGGNSGFGIDCSGLVQAALHAAGRDCPGDSDLQEAMNGTRLGEDAELRRGDLVFWKGHVGIVSDDGILIHANAHHMAVAAEPLERAIARIAATDTGPVTTRLRLADQVIRRDG